MWPPCGGSGNNINSSDAPPPDSEEASGPRGLAGTSLAPLGMANSSHSGSLSDTDGDAFFEHGHDPYDFEAMSGEELTEAMKYGDWY